MTTIRTDSIEHGPQTGSNREHRGPKAAATLSAAPHICSICSKQFVVISGDAGAGSAHGHCPCGGDLVPATLSPGVYEVRRPRKASGKRRAQAPARKPEPDVPREADLGYNESHGYGPSHGGPTGPGDAPAPSTHPPPAPSDESSSE